MSANPKIVFSDKIIKVSFFASLLLTGISSAIIAVFYTKLPPLIPFYNSMPWGEGRLAPSHFILAFPLLFIAIIVINILVSLRVHNNYMLLSRILSVNALLFIVFGFLAFVQIIFLVF